MLINTLLKLQQSAFFDCFPDKMLAEHSLFTSAVFIPFEGHMTASCYIICEIHCQTSVHLLWEFVASQDFFPVTPIP